MRSCRKYTWGGILPNVGYVRDQTVWFLSRFGLKEGMVFNHACLKSEKEYGFQMPGLKMGMNFRSHV